jgi:hypothetical protein
MAKIEDILVGMRKNPQGVHFADLVKVCMHFFGEARQLGTSHRVFCTPWPGDPRVNIQMGEGGKAKAYQVRQVLLAISKLKGVKDDQS